MPSCLRIFRSCPAHWESCALAPFPKNVLARRSVKDELRANLICKLQRREALFPGIVGYEDSVVPQVVNAVLSRHNFILLGLRGQAKTRLIRMLTTLLDPGCRTWRDARFMTIRIEPICRRCQRADRRKGDATPIAWLTPISAMSRNWRRPT